MYLYCSKSLERSIKMTKSLFHTAYILVEIASNKKNEYRCITLDIRWD